MKIFWKRAVVIVIATLSMASEQTQAVTSFVRATVIGPGLFEYSIQIDNTEGPEPLQGVILFNPNIVFGLDDASVIGAPPGWDFFPPMPPVADLLTFFSLGLADDLPIGATLGGFTFQSSVNPGNLDVSKLQIDVVGSISFDDIETEKRVIIVPDNLSTSTILGPVILLLCACQRRLQIHARRSRVPHTE